MLFSLSLAGALSLLLTAPTPARAQASGGSNVTCTYAFWEFNTIGESPCFVWGQLQSQCLTGGLTVTPLLNASYQYSPPSLSGQVNDCNCNVVSYNLMAACSWCQPNIFTNNWVTENQWKQGCTDYDSSGISGVSLAGIDIPAWAYVPDNGSSWDPDTAEAAYNATSSNGGASSPATTQAPATASAGGGGGIPTSGGGFGFSVTISPAASTTAGGGQNGGDTNGSSTSPNKTNIGAIVGGVVGGVAVIIIIALIIFFVMRRNRRSSAAAAAAAASAGTGAAGPGQWQPYGNEAKPPVPYSPENIPYAPVPTSPFPPGTTPQPYPYQPSTGYTGAPSTTAYDGSAPPTSYAGSPPPQQQGFYGQPQFGEAYGQPAGRYTGLPEA
ncbi:hypothetical protein CALVIDRAFT_563773 [Calocera viscosa TUFC12733]|uniref:Transmembrane protein n=1 Tax=Calocera viscosa (strain TUFC12733) TaxID=1330018 RepID=A0A167MH60_CALVF|nr:hypothetical protein CALVIDRAFT_563773 [Calocera viscosa TUFC12733]